MGGRVGLLPFVRQAELCTVLRCRRTRLVSFGDPLARSASTAPTHLPSWCPSRHGAQRILRATRSSFSQSGLIQLEGVAFLLIVELSHELKEQMLKLRQALAAAISYVPKVVFEGAEPFLHRGAVFDK